MTLTLEKAASGCSRLALSRRPLGMSKTAVTCCALLVWLSFRCAATVRRGYTAADRAATNARTDRSTSSGVVAQSQMLILITALPFQLEPPHQHSPDR